VLQQLREVGGMKRGAKPKGIAAASKKRKAEEKAEALAGTPLADELLAAGGDVGAAAAADFARTQPLKHAVLKGVCKEERLRAVFQQALHGLSADLCESDTSKMYQGIDLAALDGDGGKAELTHLCTLRDALYSSQMLETVASVARCGPLSPSVDCTVKIFNESCHLLPHALTPTTGRRVAFFLFITPDEEWSENDGATLDLYGTVAPRSETNPAASPARSVLPQWNTMVLLDVDKAAVPVVGISEVVSEDKTLMCLTGWYRLLEPEEAGQEPGAAAAEVGGGGAAGDNDFRAVANSAGRLSAADKEHLSKFIAAQHLEDQAIDRVCREFEDDSAAQLREFLLPR